MTSRRVDRTTLINLYYTRHLSLRKIGFIYEVSPERVRQWLERENIARRTSGWNHDSMSSSDYFDYVKSGGKESGFMIRKFLLSEQSKCSNCGSRQNLHTHHIRYPALSKDDLDILCVRCHLSKHRKDGKSKVRDLEICSAYLDGIQVNDIANQNNLSIPSIYHILRESNISTWRIREITTKEQKEICRLYNDGMNIVELAWEYQMSTGRISRLLDRCGVHKRKPGEIHASRRL